MGRVFMALTGQAGVERVCALKILRNFQAGRDAAEMTQRFLDEAKVVTKLSQENLVYVFDFGIQDRQGYLAMEYVPGKTLTEVWNRCAQAHVGFPSGVALYLISELLAGIGYAHRLDGLNLVHRDISPSNLMFTYTGGLKLIDFGLAKWDDKVAQTAAGINWGKISYMSPEQYAGKDIDGRSDLYSCGIILWELLTGRQLYGNAEARANLKEIPTPSRYNPGVSKKLDALVIKALASDPADRFANAEDMAAALLAEMPRDAGGKLPGANFMNQLFEAEMKKEAAAQRELVARAMELSARVPDHHDGLDVSATDPLCGTVLGGRYHVRRRIGEGAMGRVYEGHHTGIGKRVAIKIPHRSDRRKTELVRRFQREALAPSQIGHPNIVDVTDCGTTEDGDFFFVMEFIDGIDLDALARRDGPLGIERSLLIGLQICRALEAAHRAGIIHRDLKPSNVMLVRGRDDVADLAKVLDFGVAKFLREGDGKPDLTVADAAVGTPRYMAPEQIGGGGVVDFRADIYAVGGILYSMLSGGRSPIDGASVQDVWQRKLTRDPTPLGQFRSDIPEPIERLVMQCLARDPAARPASAEALRKDLVAIIEKTRGGPVRDRPTPVVTMAAVEPRPDLWWKAAAVVVAAALVGAIALQPFFAKRPPRASTNTTTVVR